MIVVTDILCKPFDEGMKVATFSLLKHLKQRHNCTVLSINGNERLEFVDFYFSLNKLLFNISFYKRIRGYFGSKVLYIPQASISLWSFIRARLLKIFTVKDVTILSLQPRKYSSLAKFIISAIPPDRIITPSIRTSEYLASLGFERKVLPLGIDDKRYNKIDKKGRDRLRDKYSIDHSKSVLLHVGHIRRSRNIEWLIEVKRNIPNIDVFVVGSTTTYEDEKLKKILEQNGIIALRKYIVSIEEIYQLADYYVFPVVKYDAAIETPLSVLEAMATNLPILTTRFGSLPETFQEDEHFRFIDSPEDIVAALKKGFSGNCNNREKIHAFTWDMIADRLHEMV